MNLRKPPVFLNLISRFLNFSGISAGSWLPELNNYFRLIKLTQEYRDSLVLESSILAHKTITLALNDLYTKIVTYRRGGGCMKNNTFLRTALRSLGYEVHDISSRVAHAMGPYSKSRKHQPYIYDGWNHMLTLVDLNGEWYVVDVGMGSMGPNFPYTLRGGFETTIIAPRENRLQRRAIGESYASKPTMSTYL
jgi:arylamine N-acetyltransferase